MSATDHVSVTVLVVVLTLLVAVAVGAFLFVFLCVRRGRCCACCCCCCKRRSRAADSPPNPEVAGRENAAYDFDVYPQQEAPQRGDDDDSRANPAPRTTTSTDEFRVDRPADGGAVTEPSPCSFGGAGGDVKARAPGETSASASPPSTSWKGDGFLDSNAASPTSPQRGAGRGCLAGTDAADANDAFASTAAAARETSPDAATPAGWDADDSSSVVTVTSSLSSFREEEEGEPRAQGPDADGSSREGLETVAAPRDARDVAGAAVEAGRGRGGRGRGRGGAGEAEEEIERAGFRFPVVWDNQDDGSLHAFRPISCLYRQLPPNRSKLVPQTRERLK